MIYHPLPQEREISASVKKIVTIKGLTGDLFAIHQSTSAAPRICVIMLNSGMLNRAGPQRLYWTFSKEANSAGIAVIRVDLAGVGDSSAETNETHFDNHRKEDVDAVIRYAKNTWPEAKIILQGLCAGSRVAFKSAAANTSVDGVLAWSTEIYTASQNMPQSPHEPKDRMSDYEVSDTLDSLYRFIFSFNFAKPSWWRKEYPNGNGIGRDIKRVLNSLLKYITPSEAVNEGDFLIAADSYLNQKRPVYFLFGENDERALTEFESRFPNVEQSKCLTQSYQIIEQGTHTFATHDSANKVISLSIEWLTKGFSKK